MRRSRGSCGTSASGHDVVESVGDVGVVVEAQDLRLWQGLGEFGTVALGHAPGGDDLATVLCGLQEGGDGILFGCVDESAGVDHGHVCRCVAVDEFPAVRGQAPGQFFGIDLVTRATQSDE